MMEKVLWRRQAGEGKKARLGQGSHFTKKIQASDRRLHGDLKKERREP